MTAVVSLGMFSESLSKARRLIDLALRNSADEALLHSCSALLSAVALHQAIDVALRTWAANRAVKTGEAELNSPAYSFRLKPMRIQMARLPHFLTGGALRLRQASPDAKSLHELLELRNRLVHIEDLVQSIRLTPEMIERDGDSEFYRIPIDLPDDPWEDLVNDQARRYLDVVELYISEIINPPPDELKPGRLLESTPGN